MKKLIITLLLGSFVFAGVTFNKSVGYADTDATSVTVSDGFGVDFDLNNGMSFGWDSNSGMMIKAGNLPANVGLRIGIKDNNGITNTIGLGYDWWTSSGDGISTAVGTYIDYAKSTAAESTTLRLNVSWGF